MQIRPLFSKGELLKPSTMTLTFIPIVIRFRIHPHKSGISIHFVRTSVKLKFIIAV